MQAKLHYFFLLIFLAFQNILNAQSEENKRPTDIQHYQFEITVNDTTNIIEGIATISFKPKTPNNDLNLDFSSKNNEGKGMSVKKVLLNNEPVSFRHHNDQLIIPTNKILTDSLQICKVTYQGIPQDGLIISKNKFGDRTFFADNWPDRAHNWIPCVEDLSDKAYVDFIVKAPNYYQVIANGSLKEKVNINDNYTLHHYASKTPLPTDVMVIGIARFAVQNLEEIDQIPVSTWVFPQNKDKGYFDYAQATSVLDYYIKNIAPFPFSKLANVQSKTRFGGMENASAIFYSERSVTGRRDQETLIAHEIAHQWFGDSATQTDWSHLWLSEGFATYFTNLYLEHKYGEEKLKERMTNERKKVIRFSEKQLTPVIDNTDNYMKLLNANSYEKGAWTLHMLRRKIGDEMFWKGIRAYYKKYQFSNADSSDFKNVMEDVSGKELDLFFDQWLLGTGQPELKLKWKNKKNQTNIIVEQIQKSETVFQFPLELKLILKDGSSKNEKLSINKNRQEFMVPGSSKVKEIIIDPNVNLLYKSANQ
ncbi:MAG: M1 family metallopeptidase [Bacteroidota bacterium]